MSDAAVDSFSDRRQAMLQRLAELGMMLAEQLATIAEPTDTTALQFARVAKAVRQTLALEAQLAGALEVKPVVHRPAEAPPWEKHGMTEAQWDYECREEDRLNDADGLICRLVDRDPRERLHDELNADREDLVREVAEAGFFAGDMPLSQIIARIARNLDLTPDWHGLPAEDWTYLDHRTRAELKAGVVLDDAPEGWPRLPKDFPSPTDRTVHPPDS
jgi:hypothetical protein